MFFKLKFNIISQYIDKHVIKIEKLSITVFIINIFK